MATDISTSETTDATVGVPFFEAFRFWVKLGFISFGGPAGQISIMHRELVEKRRWVGEERFLHALNFCMILPGPEAQQLAVYLGWLLHRTPGGIVAGAFFVIPSIFILLGLSYIYAAYGSVPLVVGVLSGFKPVVVAIVIEAVLKIGGRALKRRVHVFIAGGAFAAMYFFHVPFPLIVLAAGLIGFIGNQRFPGLFGSKSAPPQPKLSAPPSFESPARFVIADDAPSPVHTRPNRAHAFRVLAVGFGLWLIPFLFLGTRYGWGSLVAAEYRFFTTGALVTFGGAYSVLAYVTQAAVGAYGWLTKAQAVDGLALAETTPGPLIMVLQFIGFMAGWNHPLAGLGPTASGVVCGLVTTYVTFLPSFVFIFLGAPFIESLRGNRGLAAVLSGVTSSVVGVVLNLALVFGVAVIWPGGWSGGPSVFALSFTVAAFLALYRFKVDVLWVVLVGGLIGVIRLFF